MKTNNTTSANLSRFRPTWLIVMPLAFVCCGLSLLPAKANASLIHYYSGDSTSLSDGLANVNNGAFTAASVFNSFTVSGSSITVTGLFTNNAMDYTATTASWSIRSGVLTGLGGTVIDSATNVAATQVATTRSVLGLDEYTITVSGLSVSLSPGTYWFNVTPTGLGGSLGLAAQTTTGGATNPFYSDVDNALVFDPATNQGSQFSNFSGGVLVDPVSAAVPEPASLAVWAIGVGALIFAPRRSRRKSDS